MGLRPEFRVVANSADITAAIADRLVSIDMSDVAGIESDTLEIVLSDHDPVRPIVMPPTGAELELYLGYDGLVERMGLFVCDEIELAGWPGTMTIRAHAAIYDKSKKGKTDLQSQKTRSWPDKTKLGAMVRKIAAEHQMEAAVAKSLADITLPHYDQTEESDISFLIRVGRKYDAVVKPAGGKISVTKRGEGKTASGDDIPAVIVDAGSCSRWNLHLSRREKAGTVVAFWHSTKAGKRQKITVGSGDPVKQIRHYFPTAEAAKAAAQAEQAKRQRAETKLSVTMPGNPALAADGKITATGFREEANGDWLISRVQHSFTPGGGYVCSMDCEKQAEQTPD